MPETITGIKKVRFEFGTLEENNRGYPLYVKEQKTPVFLKKIEEKQENNKNYKFFIVYRTELIQFEHENVKYNVEFKKKVLTPNSKLVAEVAKILSPDDDYMSYIQEYYNK
jgi:hypothetical protein